MIEGIGMLKKTLVLPLLGLGIAGGLAACDDHHDNFNNFFDPSGVYEGPLTDNVTGKTTQVTLIIDENGEGRMAGQDGTYYLFKGITTSDDNVFAAFSGFSNTTDFPSGSLTTFGNLQGFGTSTGLQFTYTAQGSDSGSITLTFDDVYLNHSSLAMLAGTYTSTTSSPSYSFTVSSTGGLSGTDSNGCTYSGGFALVDQHFNAYEETFSQTCGSNTITFNGQADFVASPTPAKINLLADDNNGHFIVITLHQ